VLPAFAAYQGHGSPARAYRRLEYRWDGAGRALERGGSRLPLPDLGEVRFRWSEANPTALLVTLVGAEGGPGEAPEMHFRVAAPVGTDAPHGWTPAPHHRGAGAL
jgi:hypothetical protein